MKTWQLPVDKKRQQTTQASSEMDENIRHVVSPACRPGVFQIALFKGFPNIPHIPLPPEHSVGTNEATMAPTPKTQKVGRFGTVPERYSDSPLDRAICTTLGLHAELLTI